jgi:hypothetical protein
LESRALIASLLLVTLSSAEARAEEVICDPEDPSCVAASPVAPSSGEEVICDPEDPSCVTAPDTPPSMSSGVSTERGPELEVRALWGSGVALDVHWRDQEDIAEWTTAVDMSARVAMSPRFKLVIEGQLRHWMAAERGLERPRGELVTRAGEVWASWQGDGWSVRAGNMLNPWGVTTLVRPADVVNPRDLRSPTYLGPGQWGQRLAQPAVEAAWSGESWSLTGLVIPFFVPDQVALFGRDAAILGPRTAPGAAFPAYSLLGGLLGEAANEEAQSLFAAAGAPDETPGNASLGARLAATFANTDVAVSYLWGWDRTPWVVVDEDVGELVRIAAADGQVFEDLDLLGFFARNREVLAISNRISAKREAGETLLAVEALRRHTLTLEAARYVGPIGVRADVALSPAQTFSTQDFGTFRRPSAFGALGLSWEDVSADERILSLNVEGFWQHIWSHDSALTRALVAEARRGEPGDEALIFGDDFYGVAAAVIWDLPVFKLRAQLGGNFNIASRDGFGSLRVERTWMGWLTGVVGATIHEGPDPAGRLTIGGLLDGNDQVFMGLEGRY